MQDTQELHERGKLVSTPSCMHAEAYHATKAAKHIKQWGLLNAIRYCKKRGVPVSLFRLAQQLEIEKGNAK